MISSILLNKVLFRKATAACVIITSIILSACQEQTVILSPTPTPSSEVKITPTETTPAVDPDPSKTATATPQTPANLMVDPDDLAGISVRFLHPWTGEPALALEEIATQFSLTNPWGIWVDVQSQGSEMQLVAKLQSEIESGEPPGLIAVHPYLLNALGDVYKSIPIEDYFDSPEWGFEPDAQEDIPATFLEQFQSEGNLTALPIAPEAMVLFYNQTWAEELAFSSPPGDERAFQEQVCEATYTNLRDTSIDNDGTGGWLVSHDPEVLVSWHYAFGGQLPITDPPYFNDEANRQAFGFLKDVYDEGCLWIGRQSEPYYYFANRYALMYAGALDEIPKQSGWLAVAENEDEWHAIGFPGPEGNIVLVDSPGLFISQDSPEKQLAAWLFARHLLEPDVQAELVQHLFTIPVRYSASEYLEDFGNEFPQWAEIVDGMDVMDVLPVSEEWGIAQWVLQDAFDRVLQSDADQLSDILEEMDRLISELQEGEP